MRLLSIANLQPGLLVGRPVVDDKGQILLNKGVQLTREYIRALEAKGFRSIYVAEDETGVNIEDDEDLNPQTRAKAIFAMRKAFEAIEKQVPDLRDMSYDDLKKVCASDVVRDLMREGGPFFDITGVVSDIVDEVLTRNTLAGLTSIKSVDSALYNHSVDVCVVAVMVARSCGATPKQIKQLATGCLLHDIGKLFVSHSASEVSMVRQHTLLGYELLKNSPEPDLLAPHVALEHHERQDGTGQPRGLIGSNTIERNRDLPPPIPTLIGEIAAVANVYDNLLTGSPSRPPMTPDTVVQAIRNAAGGHLNRAIVGAFIRLVPVYPLGTEVIVRSETYRNYTGLVTGINPSRLDKPVVTLIRDNRGLPISSIEIDLARDDSLRVRCKFT